MSISSACEGTVWRRDEAVEGLEAPAAPPPPCRAMGSGFIVGAGRWGVLVCRQGDGRERRKWESWRVTGSARKQIDRDEGTVGQSSRVGCFAVFHDPAPVMQRAAAPVEVDRPCQPRRGCNLGSGDPPQSPLNACGALFWCRGGGTGTSAQCAVDNGCVGSSPIRAGDAWPRDRDVPHLRPHRERKDPTQVTGAVFKLRRTTASTMRWMIESSLLSPTCFINMTGIARTAPGLLMEACLGLTPQLCPSASQRSVDVDSAQGLDSTLGLEGHNSISIILDALSSIIQHQPIGSYRPRKPTYCRYSTYSTYPSASPNTITQLCSDPPTLCRADRGCNCLRVYLT